MYAMWGKYAASDARGATTHVAAHTKTTAIQKKSDWGKSHKTAPSETREK